VAVTNQNFINEEIKTRLNSGNACYNSFQNHLSPSLLSKNIQIETYRTVTLPTVLYGYEIWSLTLRKEHRIRVSENNAQILHTL
jgi:hypothetical protein